MPCTACNLAKEEFLTQKHSLLTLAPLMIFLQELLACTQEA